MMADLVSVMHATQRPTQGPQQPEPSGLLSLNILFKQKKGSLCKTNCRAIEVAVLYPQSYFSPSNSSEPADSVAVDDEFGLEEDKERSPTETLEHNLAAMSADQEPAISPITKISSRDDDASQDACFPLMNLPLELRLKIYAYLLPPRHHTIVTQLPHNGFFYNTSSIPAHSAQSFYPFGTKAPSNLTTYKVLTSNFRSSYPSPSIHPEILRVSKQVKEEAEPVLYGNSEAVWDFGIHLEALKAFWGDRSRDARAMVRNVRIGREIPCLENRGETVPRSADATWISLFEFLKTELTGLRSLDLIVWSSSGETSLFPVSASDSVAETAAEGDREEDEKRGEEELRRWREWEWTRDLLEMDALRQARITWWGFQNIRGQNGEGSFDSWLAGRMVGDRLVRERMVREGVVEEGVVVLRGLGE